MLKKKSVFVIDLWLIFNGIALFFFAPSQILRNLEDCYSKSLNYIFVITKQPAHPKWIYQVWADANSLDINSFFFCPVAPYLDATWI